MTTRSVFVRGMRIALPLGLAGTIVGMSAGAVIAAANPTVARGDGSDATSSTTTSNTCFHVNATVPHSFTGAGPTATLAIVDPTGASHAAGSATVDRQTDKHITFDFSTGSLSWSDSCSGGSEAPNGLYTAQLSGAVKGSATFRVSIPPAAPTGFSASVNGTVVNFSWHANSEPDILGYDIVEDSGTDATPGGIDPSVCGGRNCSVAVDFGNSAQGTSHSFAVVAWRHTAPGSSNYVASAPSGSQTVNFPAPPPSPTPSPTGGNGSGTGNGSGNGSGSGTGSGNGSGSGSGSGNGSGSGLGSGSGSNGAGGGPALGPGAGNSSGGNSTANLKRSIPAISAGNAPNIPSIETQIEPLPIGTYKPQLPYGSQYSLKTLHKSTPGVASEVVQNISKVLDIGPLWRGLAGFAILMLVAAHLRAWVEQVQGD